MGVQTSYENEHAEGFVGQYADLQLSNVFSRTIEDAEVDFGLAVVRGTADDQAILPSATGGSLLGITGRTIAGTANTAGDRKYQVGESANILDEGVIYAICEDGCTQGDPVFFRHTTGTGTVIGALRTDADTATADEIPNAVWDQTIAAGEIGRVKFK